jgi:hypothetical protein
MSAYSGGIVSSDTMQKNEALILRRKSNNSISQLQPPVICRGASIFFKELPRFAKRQLSEASWGEEEIASKFLATLSPSLPGP